MSPSSDSHSHVGLSCLLGQVRRRAARRGFQFSLIAVGESGLGKSTLINSMFSADILDREARESSVTRREKTVQVERQTVLLEEGGVRLLLTVVDTPGESLSHFVIPARTISRIRRPGRQHGVLGPHHQLHGGAVQHVPRGRDESQQRGSGGHEGPRLPLLHLSHRTRAERHRPRLSPEAAGRGGRRMLMSSSLTSLLGQHHPRHREERHPHTRGASDFQTDGEKSLS